ncbi:type IV inositol polyphosphate 5-phosphatase 11 isoform X2 [Magnolia sinica]|uniref:type IV inositol polyphosphate 5-phosphatase 11 isoform X2 n=1 Tax=Magnolia sinica TaxID=86752 RepID=UPI00265A7A2E|nr:type IV inositol polyphosphate 5-phosphatase 11 isoform X2 [Magnolia sinica]
MGNSCTVHAVRRRSRDRHKRLTATNTHHSIHEGIKTVVAENFCESSSNVPVLCMCIVTWNMNGKVSSEDFVELIGGNRNFDLFVVGLQEVPRHNVARLLKAILVDTHRLVGEAIMQSLQLFVFGQKNSDLSTKVKVEKHSIGGFGGLIGRKKGAVTISLSFKGVHMQFTSCHLSAHTRNVEERNLEWRYICHALLSNRNPYARPPHITVWLGDLNYRIQGIETSPARSLIQKNLHKTLTSKDQLLREAERGQIFNGYCEGTLAFKPTYKYNVGSSDYDTSYKGRVPSWTDRILFKIEESADIDVALRSYESVDSIDSSDHKPVRAHLCLKINNPQSNFPLRNQVL